MSRLPGPMQDAELKIHLGDVTYYFDGQPKPPIFKRFSEFVTKKKTNAFDKANVVAADRRCCLPSCSFVTAPGSWEPMKSSTS